MQEQGFAATGLTQVIEVSGAPKGSFYYHFREGKEQLAVEALQLAGGKIEELLRALGGATDDPVELVSRFVDAEITQMTRSSYRQGCPIATVALEMASESESIRTACQRIYAGWISALSEAFTPRLGDRAADAAEHVIAALEGALLLARVAQDPGPLRRTRDLLISGVLGGPAPAVDG